MSELHSGNTALPEQTRTLLRALEAKKGDRFQTNFFLKPGPGEDSKQEFQSWREAWRNPLTNKWEVSEHATMPDFYTGAGENGAAERRQTLRADLCFFDAIYQCALFEVSERKFGRAQVQKKLDKDQPHYAEFAAAEGVPLDKTGMPLLAAFGRILTDGDYDEAARKIAAKSPKDINFVKPPEDTAVFSDRNALAVTSSLPAVINSSKDLSVAGQHNQAKLNLAAQALAKSVKDVQRALNKCREDNFVWCSDKQVFWIPLVPIIGQVVLFSCWRQFRNDFPRAVFKRAVNNLRAECNKAAGLLDTEPLMNFANDAVMVFKILHARQASRNFINVSGSERTMNKCVGAFKASAAKKVWSEERTAEIVTALGHDVNNKKFDDQLSFQLQESANKVTAYVKAFSGP